MHGITMHLFKHEYLILIPQGNDNGGNQTFFTSFTWRTTKPNYKSNNVDMIMNTWSNARNVPTMANLAIGQLNVYIH
jgi:hypothetical protein